MQEIFLYNAETRTKDSRSSYSVDATEANGVQRSHSDESVCLWLRIYLIFNPWWMISPCYRLMCTNKTCFAGVRTRPKTIFRVKLCFLSYPCESIFFWTFLSADQTSILCVIQVLPVLEWKLIFVLISKILDCLKRLFVVQIPRITVYREMRNIYLQQLFVGAVTKSKWGGLVWKLKNWYRQKL